MLALCASVSARTVAYVVDFPNADKCPPKSQAYNVSVTVGLDQTVLGVMATAAENLYSEQKSNGLDFGASYFGQYSGFLINSIGGTAATECCYWLFAYRYPGSTEDTSASLGVSGTVPGEGWLIRMSYVYDSDNPNCPSLSDKKEL